MNKSKTEQKEKIYGHEKELHIPVHETELEKDVHGHETDFKKSWNFVKC